MFLFQTLVIATERTVTAGKCFFRYLALQGPGFLVGSDGEESAFNAGDPGLIPGLGRSPGGGHGNPVQYSCLENPHGQRSLAGYSPWARKESDTTKQLTTTAGTKLPGSLNVAKMPLFAEIQVP